MTTHTDTGVAGFLRHPPRVVVVAARVASALELALGAVALLLIFFLVLLQAAQRYLPIEGWSWTGELARFSLVWLTFVVAGVLVTRDSHISIEMIDGLRSPVILRSTRVVSSLIVAAVGVALTAEAWELVDTQGILKSPALGMPMSWLYAVTMIGCVSVVVRASVQAVRIAVLGVPDPDTDDDAVMSE